MFYLMKYDLHPLSRWIMVDFTADPLLKFQITTWQSWMEMIMKMDGYKNRGSMYIIKGVNMRERLIV